MTTGELPFEGDTYDPRKDRERLTRQLDAVREYLIARMGNGVWYTAQEIADWTCYADSVPAVGARIRDLRKEKGGRYTIPKRRRGEGRRGVWEYAMTGGKGTGTPIIAHCCCCTCDCEKCCR